MTASERKRLGKHWAKLDDIKQQKLIELKKYYLEFKTEIDAELKAEAEANK